MRKQTHQISVAQDSDGNNGHYTHVLLNALDQPGLKAEEVFKRVRVNITTRTGRKQVLWVSSSLTGEFVFNDAATSTANATTSSAPDKHSQQTSSAAEISYWESVRDSGNASAFQSYLGCYPDVTFADLGAGGQARAATSACPSIAGDWHQISPSLKCESMLTFTPTTASTFGVKDTGYGNVTGKATRNGNLVRLAWIGADFMYRPYGIHHQSTV